MKKKQHIETQLLGLDLSSVNPNSLEEYEYEKSRIPNHANSSSSSDSNSPSLEDLPYPKKRSRRSAIIKNSPERLSIAPSQKSQADTSFISHSLSSSFIFANLEYPELLELISSMTLQLFQKDSEIIPSLSGTADFFIVKSGKAKLKISQNQFEELTPGSLIGELSLLHDNLNDYQVFAAEDSECWVLARESFAKLAKKTAPIKRQKFKNLINKAFEGTTNEELEKLVDGCRLQVFCVGEFVARRGVNSGKVLVIYEGSAMNLSNKEFDVVWEEDLSESVVAESLVKGISFSKGCLVRILGEDYFKYIRKND